MKANTKTKGASVGNRVTRIVLAPLLGLVTLGLLLLVILWAVLGDTKINANAALPYLTPRLEAMIADRTGEDTKIRIDGANVLVDLNDRIAEVEALGVSIATEDGGMARLQRAFFKLPIQTNFEGTIGPVILSGVEARLARDLDGQISINGFTAPELQNFAKAFQGDGAGWTPPVLITDVNAVLSDETMGFSLPLRADRIDVISLTNSSEIFGELRVRYGDFVGSKIVANLSVPRDLDQRIVGLELSGFDMARLEASGLVDLIGIDLTGAATGDVTLVFDRRFSLEAVRGNIGVKDAGLTGNALPEDLNILFAEGSFRLDPEDLSFVVEDLVATGDIWTAGLQFEGELLPTKAGDAIIGIAGAATQLSATLNAPDYFDAPHQIRSDSLAVSFKAEPFDFEVSGKLSVDNVELNLEGSSTVEDQVFANRYRVLSEPRLVEDVLSFWPKGVVPNTRAWAIDALKDAEIANLDAAISAVGGTTSLRMNFDFSGANANIIKGFPPISHASGFAQLTEKDFAVDISKGTVYLPNEAGGTYGVDVSGSRFLIPDIAPKQPDSQAKILAKGTLDGLAAVLDHPPFGFLTKTGAAFPDASGLVEAEIDLDIPLQKRIATEDVDVNAAFQVLNFKSDRLLQGRLLAADVLNATTDGQSLELTGDVALDGHPAKMSLYQNFADDGQTDVTVNTKLTPDLARSFGVPTNDLRMDGESNATVNLAIAKDAPVQFKARSDLEGLALSVPQIGWRKSASRSGDLLVSGSVLDGATGPVLFEIDAPGLDAQGTVNGQKTSINSAQIGRWFNGAAELAPGRRPEISAKSIDLRAMPKSLSSGGGAGAKIYTDRLTVAPNIYLTGLRGEIIDGKIDVFTGRLNGGVPVRIEIKETADGPEYRIQGDDAGAALARLGIFQDVRGGSFDMTVRESSRGPVGRFKLSDIRVVDAGPLVALLDSLSIVGLLQQLQGPGLRFDSVRGEVLIAKNGVEIRSINANGASLGFTTAGVYLPKAKQLNLEGVVTPLYPINGVFERTLGNAAGRERGEGLFSFTYRMSGPAEDPKVRVNPLSILLPGVTREIVRGKTPTLPE